MRTTCRVVLFLLFIIGFSSLSMGQNIVIKQTHESGIYQKGENIRVTVSLKDLELDSLSVKILENNINTIKDEKVPVTGEELLVFEGSRDEPGSLIFQVRSGRNFAGTGAVIEPEKIKPGSKRPKDFDKYWKAEKKALRALPMEVKSVPVDTIESGYVCSDMEINCTGPKPARGYYAKPENAEPKSLPIVLYVHAAGVAGDWCLAKPENAMRYAKMGKGALCFDLNAHGMLDGQPLSYYMDLQKGELNRYFYSGVENRDDFYFRGMYLRLIRTLDFLESQPEWDGKRILVIGESQGGGQALAAAGLDKHVTAAVAIVPAMCDWGGRLVGRAGGWPDPLSTKNDQEKMKQTLPYFDNAHLLKGSKATLVTEIGFIDVTCPSTSVYAAINQAKGKKITFGVPYRGHHLDQRWLQDYWEKTVDAPRNEFIKDFLK